MCSIFLSTDKEKFLELIELNQSRGKFSYSFSVVEKEKFHLIKKDLGLFDKNLIIQKSDLYIGHCQSPTNGLEPNIFRIHPSCIDNQYFFHNGILKPSFLQKSTIDFEGWDTFYLNYLLLNGFEVLSEVEGSFAGLLIKNDIFYFFRNNLCPLFLEYSEGKSISLSSVKFKGSKSIKSGFVYKIDIRNLKIENFQSFEDKNLVYNKKVENEFNRSSF